MGTEVFRLSKATGLLDDFEITDAWDFGGGGGEGSPGRRCSYSYHMPYVSDNDTTFPLNSVSNPGSPLCADRNPYLDLNAEQHFQDESNPHPFDEWTVNDRYEFYDPQGRMNSATHQFEGQNVLFNDHHVRFEKHPNVGIQNDNIWLQWDLTWVSPPSQEREAGSAKIMDLYLDGQGGPVCAKDAYLVNELND